jgi:hypothetical protein
MPKAVDIATSAASRPRPMTMRPMRVVARVYGVPTAIEKDFGPGAEIHGIGINRNADVAEIAGAITRGNVHAPAERYGEMREVAAYTNALMQGSAGAAGGPASEKLQRVFACTKSQIACTRWRPPTIISKFDETKSASLSLSQYLLWSRNRSTHREGRLSVSYPRRAAFHLVGASHE